MEPGRQGDPGTKAHSGSAKKTVQDGEFGKNSSQQGEKVVFLWDNLL